MQMKMIFNSRNLSIAVAVLLTAMLFYYTGAIGAHNHLDEMGPHFCNHHGDDFPEHNLTGNTGFGNLSIACFKPVKACIFESLMLTMSTQMFSAAFALLPHREITGRWLSPVSGLCFPLLYNVVGGRAPPLSF